MSSAQVSRVYSAPFTGLKNDGRGGWIPRVPGACKNHFGQGLAAFGRVGAGRDVVRAIHARAEASDRLRTPIAIAHVARVG